ncbi:hypothetical protein HDA40_006115 [Hamadaea flava]|uniref:Uncharacterized protein n=1 Tax=Hamadaea flava TaxID=1742688 RepID=A0ABV8LU36_9ACTN|nr:hypothetical protein [Hamadaea flava]MCP2327608.1 hypothetical protein [Hamadaea flava]
MNAIVFVPMAADRQRWIDLCLDYCAERRYVVTSIVFGADDALAMLVGDPKAVLVTARMDMLPRVEAVVDKRTPARPNERERRPRRVAVAHMRGDR